jgi:hypothetical protein
MDYRDDRDALRARVNELEQALREAGARANRAEVQLADARQALNEREAELRRFRGDVPTKSGRGTSVAIALGAGALLLLVLCGGTTAALVYMRSRPPPPAPVAPVEAAPSAAVPEVVPQSSSAPAAKPGSSPSDAGMFQWGWGWQPSVVPMKLDDDDTEDFIGAYRILSANLQLYVGGFDGRSLKGTWSAGPYGTLSEGAVSTWLAVVGRRVLVTDFRARGHVLDARTGHELSVVTFSDKARRACAAPNGHGALVEVSDGKNVVVDLETFAVTPAPHAEKCPGSFSDEVCAFAGAPCVEATANAPETRGHWTLGAGAGAVTLGVKNPGTATPIAFAAGGHGWKTVIPEDPARVETSPRDGGADLAGGLFVTTYGLVGHGGARLVALDAATGERKWDVAIPGSDTAPAGVRATASRVYVPHWTKLHVFDLKTGRLIGTLGR